VRELEFLPPEYIRTRRQRRVGFIRSWLLLAMGMAMVLWSLQIGFWVREAQAELAALQGTDTAMNPDVTKVRRLRAEAYTYKRRIELLRMLQPTATATALLTSLSDLLPEGVVVDDLSVDCGTKVPPDRITLCLSAVAPTEAMVTQTLGALEASPTFDGATLLESKPAKDGPGGRRAFVVEINACPNAPAKE
jgi:Tfp pilus assembly protein PilN